MNDFSIALVIVAAFSVVGLGFLFAADRGRGYNFWDMDDGSDPASDDSKGQVNGKDDND